jgi:pyruvate dehydrogenase E1 component
MYGPDEEDVFYYLTLYNENYEMPARPDGITDADITQGLYRWAPAPDGVDHRATILFSGPAQAAARHAQTDLAEHHGIGVDLWSATSYKRLREDALVAERHNRLFPDEEPHVPLVTRLLADRPGPVIAVSDYMKLVPDQIARWVPGPFVPLGTDGFGRSDTREALRRFFEVDAPHTVVATLAALDDTDGVRKALDRYDLTPDPLDPTHR